jgi:predicted lipoprotein with Yx(FWY)xxD motif
MNRTTSLTSVAGSAVLLLGALGVAGCGSSGGSSSSGAPASPKTVSGQPATFGVANGSLGKFLVDGDGRTLYVFQRDTGKTSTCVGACATDWPPLRVTGAPTVGRGLKASIAATTHRADGNPQATYNGHPLYVFSGDQKPGDVRGQGVNAFGGLWYAVSPAGDQVTTKAASSGTSY